MAFGPQGIATQGFVHTLSLQDSTEAQSSFDLHPNKHILFRHICPKKQSLSTLQVKAQWFLKHFSFNAQ